MDVLLGHGQVRVDSSAGPIDTCFDRSVNNVTLNAREDKRDRNREGRGKSGCGDIGSLSSQSDL